MKTAARVGLTVITTILGTCALSAPSRLSSSSSPRPAIVATGFHNHGDVEGSGAKGAPDLYGNEVSDAVTRYRLDDEGGLYEVHSPQIELPSLGSPIS